MFFLRLVYWEMWFKKDLCFFWHTDRFIEINCNSDELKISISELHYCEREKKHVCIYILDYLYCKKSCIKIRCMYEHRWNIIIFITQEGQRVS